MLRIFDIFFSFTGILIISPIFVVLFVLGLFESGSPIFIQKRLGKSKQTFFLFKFRTMIPETKSIATHLVDPSSVTKYGKFLRKSKLDELPQLYNVLIGDMSLVGPRPNLPNQKELIKERDMLGIYGFRPGVTGLAQINNIDMSSPKLLAQKDYEMTKSLGFCNYFNIIFKTIFGKGFGDSLYR